MECLRPVTWWLPDFFAGEEGYLKISESPFLLCKMGWGQCDVREAVNSPLYRG